MAPRRLRVLLAENRLSEAGIILRSLCAGAGWALELKFVGRRADLGHALAARCPELALVDLSLLHPDALAFLGVLIPTNPAVPFILFTDPADKTCAEQCLSMGAADFLLEGFMDERTMARALHSAVGHGVAEEPSPLSPKLISAWNRDSFSASSDRLLIGSLRPFRCTCSVLVCVENLEQLLLDAGEHAVDQIQQEMMEVLKRDVRPSDEVTRVSSGHMQANFVGRQSLGASRHE